MAAFHGKQGSALFSTTSYELISFSIDAVAETADSTIMNKTASTSAIHWKDYVAGFKDWTATLECLEPAAGGGIAVLGTEALLTLDTTSGLEYAGSAICTGFGPSVSTTGAGALTVTFQGTAQLVAA